MYGLLEDRCLDDVVSRAEQARLSYSLQHEEFRYLNANLQVYLTDMKRIEDENRQLEGMIEQIRNDYILTLEQHLKRLPNDFRQESQTLNNAHLERYRSKSRARRHLNEREETKKRIQFLVSQEKEASKRCNQLQKQERSMNNEMAKLNEQMQHLLRHVENEKQTHRQAMEKVDQLQLQLEQACVQRSKTEVMSLCHSCLRSHRSLPSSKFKPWGKKWNWCKPQRNFSMKNSKRFWPLRQMRMNIFSHGWIKRSHVSAMISINWIRRSWNR